MKSLIHCGVKWSRAKLERFKRVIAQTAGNTILFEDKIFERDYVPYLVTFLEERIDS